MKLFHFLVFFILSFIGLHAQSDIYKLNPVLGKTLNIQGDYVTFIRGDDIVINRTVIPVKVVEKIEVIYNDKLNEIKSAVKNVEQKNQNLFATIEKLQQQTKASVAQAATLVNEFKTLDLKEGNKLISQAYEAFNNGDIDQAIFILDELKLEQEDAKLATTYRFKARALTTLFKFDDAEENFASAARIFDSFENIQSYGDFLTQQQKYTKMVSVFSNYSPKSTRQKFYIKNQLGRGYIFMERFEDALSESIEALNVSKQLMNEEEGNQDLTKEYSNFMAYSQLGETYRAIGQFQEAIDAFKQAEIVMTKLLIKTNNATDLRVMSINLSGGLAMVMNAIDNNKEAQFYYKQALETYAKTKEIYPFSQSEISGIGTLNTNLALSYFRSKLYKEGEIELEKGITILEKLTKTNEAYLSNLAFAYTLAAIILGGSDNPTDVYKYGKKANDIYKKLEVEAATESYIALNDFIIGEYFLEVEKDRSKALPYFEKSLKIVEDRFQKNEHKENFPRIYKFDLFRFSLYYFCARLYQEDFFTKKSNTYLDFLKKSWDAYDKAEYKSPSMKERAFYCLITIVEIEPDISYLHHADQLFKLYFSDTNLIENKVRLAELQRAFGNYYFMAIRDYDSAIPHFKALTTTAASLIQSRPIEEYYGLRIASHHRLRQCYQMKDSIVLALEHNAKATNDRIHLISNLKKEKYIIPITSSYFFGATNYEFIDEYESADEYFKNAIIYFEKSLEKEQKIEFIEDYMFFQLDYAKALFLRYLKSGNASDKNKTYQFVNQIRNFNSQVSTDLKNHITKKMSYIKEDLDLTETEEERKQTYIYELNMRAEKIYNKGWNKLQAQTCQNGLKLCDQFIQEYPKSEMINGVLEDKTMFYEGLIQTSDKPKKFLDWAIKSDKISNTLATVYPEDASYIKENSDNLMSEAWIVNGHLEKAKKRNKGAFEFRESHRQLANKAIIFILENNYDSAKKLFEEYKDQRLYRSSILYKRKFLSKIYFYKQYGVDHSDFEKAIQYLN